MSWLRVANAPLEGLNSFVRHLHRRGILPVYSSPVPVVSVGNIAMGGTGKTPLVEALARELQTLGHKPAVLTRGYGRRTSDPLLLVRPPGEKWQEVGDEPALLAERLPGVPLVVDRDRVRGATTAVALCGASHLVLDDGFQHWRLGRALDLVVVSAADPLARRVPRREPPRALKYASRVLVVGSEPSLAAVQALAPYHPLPPFWVRLLVRGVQWQGKLHPPSFLQGTPVLAFAGIAQPQRFFAQLEALGAKLLRTFSFPDHHPFRLGELEPIFSLAQTSHALPLTTGKDVVRLPRAFREQVGWLEVVCEPAGEESFLQLLQPVLPPS